MSVWHSLKTSWVWAQILTLFWVRRQTKVSSAQPLHFPDDKWWVALIDFSADMTSPTSLFFIQVILSKASDFLYYVFKEFSSWFITGMSAPQVYVLRLTGVTQRINDNVGKYNKKPLWLNMKLQHNRKKPPKIVEMLTQNYIPIITVYVSTTLHSTILIK